VRGSEPDPASRDVRDRRAKLDRPARPHLSVVMPVYNERATIREILLQVCAVNIDKEVIIVDDGSTDGTGELLAKLASHEDCACENHAPGNQVAGALRSAVDHLQDLGRLRIFFQPKNCGKGAALRRGFKEATGEIVIIQDADLELSPTEYGRLIQPIDQGRADVVYGSRFLGKARSGVPLMHYLGNKALTFASNLVTGLRLTDVWTGYKVFRREPLQEIDIREDRFGFEPEITAKIARRGLRVCEVPVSYSFRSRAAGKKIGWKDAIRGIWCTVRYSFS
jgi:glycosyltransferase involved in cell wall biosynthesis